MFKGKVPKERIDAVRRCAEAGMSAMQAADRLSTSERPLTKGSIIGLANRNGIKFGAKPGTRKPRLEANTIRAALFMGRLRA